MARAEYDLHNAYDAYKDAVNQDQLLQANVNNDGEDKDIPVHGMFVAIGHDPATAAFAGAVALDEEGYILATAGGTQTSVDGVFAAGDCVDKIYRQAVTAAGMGCMAALDAERWLGEQE